MGSWDETCALSNLPIQPGDEVYWLLLTKSPYTNFASSGCYHTDFFFPRCLPILGEYDDYGQIEPTKNEDLFIQLMLDQFKTDLIEYKYSDIPEDGLGGGSREESLGIPEVTFENLNLPNLQRQLHEGNVFINENALDNKGFEKDPDGKLIMVDKKKPVESSPVTRIMIRKDIWDAISKSSFKNWRKTYTKKYIKTMLMETLSEIKKRDVSDRELVYLITDARMSKLSGLLTDLPFANCPNEVVKDCFTDFLTGKMGESDLLRIIDRASEMGMIEMSLAWTRRAWFPTTGAGSQMENFQDNIDLYKKFISVAKKALKKLEKEREDW